MVSVAQKSKDLYQKEKILDLKTIKNEKKCQKTDKKSDKLSLFKLIFVVFIGTQKKRQKCDKSDKMSLFQFVGGHPSCIQIF